MPIGLFLVYTRDQPINLLESEFDIHKKKCFNKNSAPDQVYTQNQQIQLAWVWVWLKLVYAPHLPNRTGHIALVMSYVTIWFNSCDQVYPGCCTCNFCFPSWNIFIFGTCLRISILLHIKWPFAFCGCRQGNSCADRHMSANLRPSVRVVICYVCYVLGRITAVARC